MRVHILAKELKVPSKTIIQKCKAEGLKVTNHMSTLSAGLEATVREWFSEGRHETTVETAEPVDLANARAQAKRRAAHAKARRESEAAESGTSVATVDAPAPSSAAGGADFDAEDVSADSVVSATVATPPDSTTEAASEDDSSEATGSLAVERSDESSKVEGSGEVAAETDLAAAAASSEAFGQSAGKAESAGGAVGAESAGDSLVEDLDAGSEASDEAVAPQVPMAPAGPQNVPKPVQLKGPRVVRYEPVEQSYTPPPRRRPSPVAEVPASAGPGGEPSEPGRGKGRGAPRGGAAPASRSRGKGGEKKSSEQWREWRDRDLAERQERISDATGRRIHARRSVGSRRHAAAAPKKTEATLQEPIRMKEFCAATGVSMLQILPVLRKEFSFAANINSELSTEMAEFIATEHGVTLTIKQAKTELDVISEEFESVAPMDVRSRPPVVTFLGHVDHGKTSLLDAIRATHVTHSEDGGITQHIGAYYLEHKSAGKVTFLDTPGHEAFTAMRSRGAKLTDIVVLVVAADDGVMPQTVEAINHAKASGAPIVIALNKIDLGEQNIQRIFGQLAEHELQPSEWGGDVDVIRTSATTGIGIDELIEHLSALGDVLELQAPHKGPGFGTVIEAETKEGVGAVARVMVRGGILRTGNVVVCGHAYGKVRALIDDRGRRLKEATPSHPVEIWGLDEVPMAGDKFFEVKSLQRAKTAAEELRHVRVSEGRAASRKMRSLEEVFKIRDQGETPELNLIIRADVDGSLDALRTMLEKLPTDEVRMTIRHSAVGTVTDGDVLLADACDGIIVAFRVAPAVTVKRLAEDKGVEIRQYKVIYDVQDDVKKALEGLLTPDVSEVTRATVEVREVFKLSKIGTVAGSMVTDGTINRNHVVRLIRDGIVVRTGCKIASLKRFKDDAKDVRAGMECGIRIEGFDDVKSGDVIEAYEVVETARTL